MNDVVIGRLERKRKGGGYLHYITSAKRKGFRCFLTGFVKTLRRYFPFYDTILFAFAVFVTTLEELSGVGSVGRVVD